MHRVTSGGRHGPAATIDAAEGARRVAGHALWSGAGLVISVATARVLSGVALQGSRAAAPRPDELVLTALGWLGAALAAWLTVGCVLALGALVPGTVGRAAAALAERVTPAALRKLVTLVLGASVGSLGLPPTVLSSAGTSPTTGAWATPTAGASLAPGYRPAPAGLDAPVASYRGPADPSDLTPVTGAVPAAGAGPGYTPTTQPARSPAATPPVVRTAPEPAGPGFVPTPPVPAHDAQGAALLARPPRPTAATHGLVIVRRGDTLWSIARRHLGADASDAEVAREWPRWYAANRVVIGDDPDRILAGQQLVPPDARGAAPTRTKE